MAGVGDRKKKINEITDEHDRICKYLPGIRGQCKNLGGTKILVIDIFRIELNIVEDNHSD